MNVTDQAIDTYTESALLRYGGYIVLNRALADLRDGLKPVQRRIVYTAFREGASSDKAHKKSSGIVGTTLAKWHPHGDSAIYETLVGMVGARYPLLEGHGNFGGYMFEAAAARYTECRLSAFGERCFDAIKIATMVPNYASTDEEPLTLPVKVPLLLLNGSQGIGLGLSSSIPPHNLGEILDATTHLVKNPEATDEDLIQFMRGPDYGHGVLTSPRSTVQSLYKTGAGTLEYRCDYDTQEDEDHHVLVVRGICPGFNAKNFFSAMTKLSQDGLILYCSDQSDEHGFRILVGYKDTQVLQKRVLPLLHTSESYQWWAVYRSSEEDVIDSNTVRRLNLRAILDDFVKYRSSVETLRLQDELQVQQAKYLRFRALLVAAQHLDIVTRIMGSKYASRSAAGAALADALNEASKDATESLDADQADIILGTSLWSLSRANLADLGQQVIASYDACNDIKRRLQSIRDEVLATLEDMRKFVDKRGTRVSSRAVQLDIAEDQEVFVAARFIPGPLVRDTEIPVKSRVYYDQVVRCKERVLYVPRKDIKVLSRDTAYLDDQSMDIVGIVSDMSTVMAVLDRSGQLLVTTAGTGRLGDIHEVVSIAGGTDDMDLLVHYDNGYVLRMEKPAPYGRKKMRPILGPSKGTAVSVMFVPRNTKLYSGGEVVDASVPVKAKVLHAVSDTNYVLTKQGKRQVLSKKDLVNSFADIERTQPV